MRLRCPRRGCVVFDRPAGPARAAASDDGAADSTSTATHRRWSRDPSRAGQRAHDRRRGLERRRADRRRRRVCRRYGRIRSGPAVAGGREPSDQSAGPVSRQHERRRRSHRRQRCHREVAARHAWATARRRRRRRARVRMSASCPSRTRMRSTGCPPEAEGVPPLTGDALPASTFFTPRKDLFSNGEPVQLISPAGRAHRRRHPRVLPQVGCGCDGRCVRDDELPGHRYRTRRQRAGCHRRA